MSTFILLRIIIVYSFPVISFIGFITNIISFVIFSRKRFENTIFSTYFRFYLVFEIINPIFPINKMFELNFEMYFGLISDFCCKLRRFFSNYNASNTPWFLVIISLDRFLSITYPTRFLLRKKPIFQILISFFIIGINFVLYTPFWFYHLRQNIKNKTNQTSIISYECFSPITWLKFINLVQEFVIPFCLMSLFTFLTIRTVFNSRKSSSNNSSVAKSKDMKFAISSITINILFLLSNLPYLIVIVLKDYSNLFANQADLYNLCYSLSFLFFYFNLTITFFANYISNSMFKKEFITLVFDLKTTSENSSKSKT